MQSKDPLNEIEQLLDELESFAEKTPWYLGNRIAIGDEDFFRITRSIRELLPQELSEARKVLEKQDLILKNAKEEHKRIIDTAERRLEDLTNEEQVVIIARQQAEHIRDKARMEGESLKRDALLYTTELLEDMERQFVETVETLQKGRAILESEIGKSVQANMEAVEDDDYEPPAPPLEEGQAETGT
ncbi:hypothetical protein KDL29_12300 [bacterium]|nr:hypothetical protein [bacterium]